ncbi:unnamed protein product [Malus baccata var. baccata]
MYVSNNEELKKEILDEAHCSAYAMHPGGTKMYHTILPFYYWPGMKREIAEYQVKAERKKLFGRIQPLPVPQWKWENMTMNFVYKLPRTQNGFDCVWVIVDRLTKSAHFIPVREKYSLNKLAKLFITKIVKYHGVPVNIISDRDPRFTSKFWVAFQEALGTRLLYNTAYHPQTDGQLERTIQTLEDIHFRAISGLETKYAKKCEMEHFRAKLSRNVVYANGARGMDEFEGQRSLRNEEMKVKNEEVGIGNQNPSHVIPPQPLEINPDLMYDEEPVPILDWKDKVLRNKTVNLVKVLWRNHSVEEATWETEDRMREMYPRLFYEY